MFQNSKKKLQKWTGLIAAAAVSTCVLMSEMGVSQYAYGEEDMIVQGDAGLDEVPVQEETTAAVAAPSQVEGLFEVTGEVSDSTGDAISSGGKKDKDKSDEKKLIVGYKQVGVQASIHFDMGEKPSLDRLMQQFPAQLDVYFLGEKKARTLPVTWVCYGDDYSTTNLNYYFFTPTFDEEKYTVKGLDLQSESPYIEVVQDAFTYEMIDSAPPKENEAAVFKYCTEKLGLNTAAACGVLANIYCESGFRTNAIGDGGTSVGICQWHNGRWTNLKNYAPDDWQTLEGQLRFMKKELRTGYSNTLDYLKEVSDDEQGAYDAAYYWCMHFEMPDKIVSRSTTRGYLAKNVYWKRYGLGEEETELDGTFGDDETEAETLAETEMNVTTAARSTETEMIESETPQKAETKSGESETIPETEAAYDESAMLPETETAYDESAMLPETEDTSVKSAVTDDSVTADSTDSAQTEDADTGALTGKKSSSKDKTEKVSKNKKSAKSGMDESYAGMYYCISDNGLNIREQCSTEADVAGFIPYQDKVEVFAADGEWAKVRYGDTEGFSRLEFLEKIEDETKSE